MKYSYYSGIYYSLLKQSRKYSESDRELKLSDRNAVTFGLADSSFLMTDCLLIPYYIGNPFIILF